MNRINYSGLARTGKKGERRYVDEETCERITYDLAFSSFRKCWADAILQQLIKKVK